jgi:hypothetical protein
MYSKYGLVDEGTFSGSFPIIECQIENGRFFERPHSSDRTWDMTFIDVETDNNQFLLSTLRAGMGK